MKKYLSLLLVAGALQVAGMQSTTATTLDEKIAIAKVQTQPININTASAEQLQRLPGIGAKKALAIVDYREAHGSFANLDELTNVKGIGQKMLAKLGDQVVVN